MTLRMVNGADIITFNDEFRKVLCGPQDWSAIGCASVLETEILLRGGIYNGDLANTFMIDGVGIVNFRFRGQGKGYIQDGNVTGGIAQSDSGEIYIIHKGIINRPPHTSADTWEREQKWVRESVLLTNAEGQEKEKLYYVIGNLYGNTFRSDFISFVLFCKEQKRDQLDQFDTVDFGEVQETELMGSVRELTVRNISLVPPRGASVMDWKESRITSELQCKLKQNRVNTQQIRFSNFECDLLSEDKSIIFEIKSHGGPVAYYSAIGQLVSYRAFLDNPVSRLICVVPNVDPDRFFPVLRNLGIYVLYFIEDNGKFDFLNLLTLITELREFR